MTVIPSTHDVRHDDLGAVPLPGGLLALGLSATGLRALPAQSAEPVKFRYLASQGSISPHELASELGYFNGLGIELENVGYAQGGPASLFALAAGSVDLGSAATSAVINSIAGGNDFVAAYPSNGINDQVQSVFYVLEDSPIKSLADIAGKSIAVNTLGAHLDYTVREALHQAGLPQNAANLIVVPGPQLEQTLALRPGGHRRRSATGRPPSRALLKEHGGVRAVFDDTDVLGEIAGGFIVLRRDFIEAHPSRRAQLRRTVDAAPPTGRARTRMRRARCWPASSRSAARTPNSPNTGPASACAPGAQAVPRDLDFWIGVLEREGSLPKGKLKAADLLFDPNADAQIELRQP